MKEDMLVKARYKDAPEDEWFEVLLTEDHRMLKKENGEEITRTDLLFKPLDGEDDIVDMEKEWEEYRRETLRDALHQQAAYLARQYEAYQEGEAPKFRFNGRYFYPVYDED